jgi:AraC-like DNA-binding protein/mannose-6-phosphate isomerase-like protein (cupin superfamily)
MTDLLTADQAWTSVDPLGEALHFLHMDGVFYSRSELTAPWGMDLPTMPDCLMFHVITSGRCLLEVDGVEPRWLQPGDFALVPHGDGHQLLSESGVEATDLFAIPRVQMSERYEFMRHGNGGAPTNLICGAVRFDDPAAHHLTKLLPRLIFIEAWQSPHMEWIQSTLRLMASEAKELKPGGETIITRLADILIIQAIRSWMVEDPTAKTGWLGALQDEQIGRAILLIQRDPARAWTVASLATEVSMSRSAFAARFMELVGQSPMQYVIQWKMTTALNWIKAGKIKLSELHSQLGYQSQAAFSRAFKRFFGFPPGAARQCKMESFE